MSVYSYEFVHLKKMATTKIQMVPFIQDGCPKLKDDLRYRYDKCVVIPTMGAYFSYHSLPTYDNNYMETIKGWVQGKSMAPTYLVIGTLKSYNAVPISFFL